MPRREDDSPNWGGSRPGSGRKPTTGKTVKTVAVSLPIELADWLQQEAKFRGIPQSRLVTLALEVVRKGHFDIRLLDELGDDVQPG